MTEFIFSKTDILSGFPTVLASIGITLLCGVICALAYRFGADRPSKYMIITSLIMPTIVAAVITMVNGSIGAGVAAAGAFSLVRFRSVPGSSRDICMLFMGMAAGLVAGMGFIGYALGLTILLAVVVIAAELLLPGAKNRRQLKISVPEDLDYNGVFDEVIKEYTTYSRLDHVKTVRMGTMYELVYEIHMKKSASEKEMIDKLRCRNGNLTISLGMVPDTKDEL